MRTLVSIFVGAFLFFLAVPALRAADKVRLSITNLNMSFLPAGVAFKQGFFKEEGLDAEIIRMNVPNTVTALMTGDIGYTLIFGSVVRGALRGMPMRVVAGLLDSPTHTLVARPQYTSVKELKGKTLGIGNFGGTDDVAARLMFRHFGVDPEREIKIISLGPDRARLAALKEGLVDVASVAPPADAIGKTMGFNVIARAHELFKFPFIGLGTHLNRIKERPDEVKRVTKALIKANRFIRENREGAVKILAEWGRVERGQAEASYDSTRGVFNQNGNIPEDGLRLVIEQAKLELKIAREVSLSEVSSLAPLHEAQKELGIRER
ncbi:MAG: ABC transporter substrate-binding protein [Candidatus Binatia bacterium]